MTLMLPAMLFSQDKRATKALEIFHDEIKSTFDLLQLPGLSVAVLKDGNVIYRQMEGYADLEKKIPISEKNMFQIASVTKTFTANLMMQYEEEKKASLEDYALDYRFINTYFGWPYNIDANAKVKHFLSHTSEDGPGKSFVYNGQRFNYIYGVFEKVGSYSADQDAYSSELQKRIFKPLGLKNTIAGFPKKRTDTLFNYIAKPYIFDKKSQRFYEDTFNYRWTKVFPATGVITTMDDLVKYAASYDKHSLISQESYAEITTPVTLTDGSKSPYGIGWFTEIFEGTPIYWHYGHADSYACLLVRVPSSGYTFLLMSNSNAPSEALRLGYGHIWQSSFVVSFLKAFVYHGKRSSALATEEMIARAYFYRYAENMFNKHVGEAMPLLAGVYKLNPQRFDQNDPSLIYLLTDINDKSLENPLARLIRSFNKAGHMQPYTLNDIAQYYQKNNRPEQAIRYLKKLADSKGFETWNLVFDACKALGDEYFKKGNTDLARTYYWRAVNYQRMNYGSDEDITKTINEMNKASLKK